MKKVYVAGVVAALFFAACENTGSSTVGSYENEETSSTSDKKEDTSKEQSSENKTEKATSASIDTAKSISGAGKDSLSPHQKTQEHEPGKKM